MTKMTDFFIRYPSGACEKVCSSECHTVEELIMQKFGGVDPREYNVTIDMFDVGETSISGTEPAAVIVPTPVVAAMTADIVTPPTTVGA